MLKILGRTSSLNVRKVLWTCDELGLAYEREDWGTGFASTKSPEFLALNPNGLVPVLIDEQGALYESNTICRYLAARFGHGHLLPVEPRPRAGGRAVDGLAGHRPQPDLGLRLPRPGPPDAGL
jgi:glutathione S-transferase